MNSTSPKWFPERCVNLHVVPKIMLLLERPRRMEPCFAYRIKAAELFALANSEQYHGLKIQCERLARAYLRLAEQAERNSQLDLRDAARTERGSGAVLGGTFERPEGNALRI